jgi:hypothetical protein
MAQQPPHTITLADVQMAARAIHGHVLDTPLVPAPASVRADGGKYLGQAREYASHRCV